MLFRLHPLRFTFIAREPVHFPEAKSANILRGAFGIIFRRIACIPECKAVRECPVRATCPYARMFEPSAIAPGPSGLVDWPRPFVFRATHLDGLTIAAGQQFHFDLNLFDTQTPALACLVSTFAQLAREGLGPGRKGVELLKVEGLDQSSRARAVVYDHVFATVLPDPPVLELDLNAGETPVSRMRIRFITPTELKSGRYIAARPEFGIVAARIRDRISTLRELYGSGPLEIDFRSFGDRANLVRMTSCTLQDVNVVRRSSRTGQVHSIGGFIGEADYEGDLTEFVPYLKAAKWTGVGRQTVWGKGQIDIFHADR